MGMGIWCGYGFGFDLIAAGAATHTYVYARQNNFLTIIIDPILLPLSTRFLYNNMVMDSL